MDINIIVGINDFRWLMKYIRSFMDWDALGNFLTVVDVHKFHELEEKYKEL